ncbi:MAG TPA: hypothetical protein VMU02_11120 [bacterium]|nr:hypothetical protein [bacterium]
MESIELHWTEVDHVTTIWTDAPAPLRAGLLFRTGRIDETLVTAGQTHLIEHMVLSMMSDSGRDQNGFVGGAVTAFFTMGQPQEVCGFLADVCNGLTALRSDRLEGEKQVLAAENAARPYNLYLNLLTWRYGAVGYGLMGMPELGIQRSTLEDLRERSEQRFIDGNAILWLSGPPPADLHLRLPHGTRQALPALVSVEQAFPSWFVDDACGGIAAGATVPRVSAATIFGEIAYRRLRKRLRTMEAVSYAPSVSYEPLNADTAHLVLYGDSDRDRRAELVNVFGDVFNGLRKVDEAEVEAARKQISEHWTGALAPPRADLMVLEAKRAAMDWILGREFEPADLNYAQLQVVSAGDVETFVHDVEATAMFAVPGKAAVQPWFGKPAWLPRVPVVKGHEAICVDAPIRRERLVYGPEGVSVIFPDSSHCTVRYSELAAALYHDDGCVRLVGSDAVTVVVEPTLWRNGQNICRSIREGVPEHLLVRLGPRPADAIPKPRTTAWQRFRARLTKH